MKFKYLIYIVTDAQGKVHTCVSETTGRVWHFAPKDLDGEVIHLQQDLRHIEATCEQLGFDLRIIEKTETI